MAIVARHDVRDLPHKRAPLAWQRAGRQFTASGYGRRIPSEIMVQIPGSPRWRRVYVCCYSNAGTSYVESGPDKDWIVIYGSVEG
jgi:hypothetical protein